VSLVGSLSNSVGVGFGGFVGLLMACRVLPN
jgi:hypothetical protein